MLTAYRIADARHPIFDGTGAMLYGGRWNSPGRAVIYASESFAGAMLEVLVHSNLSILPRHHQVVRITIPEDVLLETVMAEQIPGWNGEDVAVPRAFGDRWLEEGRTAVLRVPGVVTEGREFNVLINPRHPDAGRLQSSAPEPVHWDTRLTRRQCGSTEPEAS